MVNSVRFDEDYRYGINGMERDNEVKGNGNSYTSYWRQYDPRLGRWMSDEPKPVAWESGYAAFRNNPIIYADPSGDWPKIGAFLKKLFGGGKGKAAARTPSRNGGPVRNLPGADYSGSASTASSAASSSTSRIKSSFINFLSNDPAFIGITIAGNWLANLNLEGNYRGNENWHGIMFTSEFGKVATQSDKGHVDQTIEVGAAVTALAASAKAVEPEFLPPNATELAEVLLESKNKSALPKQTDKSIKNQQQSPHRQNNTTPSNTQKENLTLKATGGKYKEVYYFNSEYWGKTPDLGLHNVSNSDFIGKLKEAKLINTRQGMYK